MKNQMILGLRTTVYRVKDITQAKLWYTKAFGVEPYFDQPFYVGFNVGGYELALQPQGETNEPKGENVVTYWGTNSIETAYSHFVACGAEEHEQPTNVGGELMVATVKDPWGNLIGLIYNPYFKHE